MYSFFMIIITILETLLIRIWIENSENLFFLEIFSENGMIVAC